MFGQLRKRYLLNHSQRYIWLIAIAVVIVAVAAGRTYQRFTIIDRPFWSDPAYDHAHVMLEVGGKKRKVELVNTPASMSQGLSDRSEIGSEGMLFIFLTKMQPQFWMKSMQFDLDLVWIADGRIVEITPRVPHPLPARPPNSLPLYQPQQAVDWVLEVPAGVAEEWQLQPGMPVQLFKR